MTTPRPGRSLRRQIVLVVVGVTAAGVVVLTTLLHLVMEDLSRGDVERVLVSRADTVVEGVRVASTRELAVEPGSLDVGEVVYGDGGRLVAGTPLRGLEAEYRRLSTATTATQRRVDELATLRAEPVETTAGRAVVVVGVSLRAYETAEGYALALSVASGVAVIAFAGFVASWVTRRAFRPVGEMAATAAAWSEHDLGARFDLGPPTTELTALGATLDGLLDQVAGAIRAEQRLTSELAHELRTPLTTIQGLTDLALLRDDLPPGARAQLEEVAATTRSMARTVTTLLEVARTAPAPSTSSLTDVVDAAVTAVRPGSLAGAGEGPTVRVDIADHRLGVPHDLALRALIPVLENSLVHARSAVTVRAGAPHGGRVAVVVEDDGAGVAADDDIFEPGVSTGGTGLGLALARRVARTAGGDVVLTRGEGPTRFEVRLPTG